MAHHISNRELRALERDQQMRQREDDIIRERQREINGESITMEDMTEGDRMRMDRELEMIRTQREQLSRDRLVRKTFVLDHEADTTYVKRLEEDTIEQHDETESIDNMAFKADTNSLIDREEQNVESVLEKSLSVSKEIEALEKTLHMIDMEEKEERRREREEELEMELIRKNEELEEEKKMIQRIKDQQRQDFEKFREIRNELEKKVEDMRKEAIISSNFEKKRFETFKSELLEEIEHQRRQDKEFIREELDRRRRELELEMRTSGKELGKVSGKEFTIGDRDVFRNHGTNPKSERIELPIKLEKGNRDKLTVEQIRQELNRKQREKDELERKKSEIERTTRYKYNHENLSHRSEEIPIDRTDTVNKRIGEDIVTGKRPGDMSDLLHRLNEHEERDRRREEDFKLLRDSILKELRNTEKENGSKEEVKAKRTWDGTYNRKVEGTENIDQHKNGNRSSTYTPKFTMFSGEEPKPKGECTYEEWRYEVNCFIEQSSEPNYVITQAMMRSLKGQAKRVLVSLGPSVNALEILDRLENVFGNVSSSESIMQEFYLEKQKSGESVTSWALRIEEILNRAITKGHITQLESNEMLRNKFWKGLSSEKLREATRIYFENSKSFEELRKLVRAEEREQSINPVIVQTQSVKRERTEESKLDQLLERMKKLEDQMRNRSPLPYSNVRDTNPRGRTGYFGSGRGRPWVRRSQYQSNQRGKERDSRGLTGEKDSQKDNSQANKKESNINPPKNLNA